MSRTSMNNSSWKQLSSKIAYENPWIRIREDQVVRPDGSEGFYGVVENKGAAVFIIALTDKDEVYLIHQYRYPTQMLSWEIVAGGCDGEEIKAAAKRELHEETGLEAREWQEVGSFQMLNGVCDGMGYVFIARQLEQTQQNKQSEEGIIDMRVVPFKEVLQMVKRGEITDAQTIAALLQAALFTGLAID